MLQNVYFLITICIRREMQSLGDTIVNYDNFLGDPVSRVTIGALKAILFLSCTKS